MGATSPLITGLLIFSRAACHVSYVHSQSCYMTISACQPCLVTDKAGSTMTRLLLGARTKASCQSVTKELTDWAAYKEELLKSRHLLLNRKAGWWWSTWEKVWWGLFALLWCSLWGVSWFHKYYLNMQMKPLGVFDIRIQWYKIFCGGNKILSKASSRNDPDGQKDDDEIKDGWDKNGKKKQQKEERIEAQRGQRGIEEEENTSSFFLFFVNFLWL